MTKHTKAEQAEALETLRRCFPPASTCYTILRKVSASGMSRNISVVSFDGGTPSHPNWAVSVACGLPWVTAFNDAVRVKGCGMDMGWHLVYCINHALGYEGEDRLKHRWL